MSSEWPLIDVDQVCELIVDCVNKTAPVVTHETPFRMIRTTNIREGRISLESCRFVEKETYEKWTRRAKLQYGDVLLTREAPIGEVGFVVEPEGLFLGQRVMQYRANVRVLHPRFLHYVFQSPSLQHQFGSHEGSGSVVSHIRVGDCFKFKIPLPPLPIQQGVAELLGAIDDRITLLRETNATLEAIAQALFKSWFVDFDPVRAKAEGLEPQAMDAPIAALFPDSFEESELGLVPKGWRVTSLGKICDFQKGCSYKGAGLSDDSGAYMFNLGCFNAPRIFAFEKLKRYTGDYKDRHSVVAGDLIMANTDMTQDRVILGRALIVPEGLIPGFVSHHVFKIGIEESSKLELTPYLFLSFLQREFREKVVGHATGSVVLALPKDALVKHQIVIPPKKVLEIFSGVISPLFSAVHKNELKTQTLTQLRDTLLPRLISGQLRLPEAEQAVEQALA